MNILKIVWLIATLYVFIKLCHAIGKYVAQKIGQTKANAYLVLFLIVGSIALHIEDALLGGSKFTTWFLTVLALFHLACYLYRKSCRKYVFPMYLNTHNQIKDLKKQLEEINIESTPELDELYEDEKRLFNMLTPLLKMELRDVIGYQKETK